MSSLGNKGLLKTKKTNTAKDRKDYKEYVVHAMQATFSLGKVQTLLVKGSYIPVKDPLHFVATHLSVTLDFLEDIISVKRTQRGYVPHLKPGSLDTHGLSVKYKNLITTNLHRRPLVDIKNKGLTMWAYRSRLGARMAMMLHLLINIRMQEGNHWSSDFLELSKEIVLLLPLSKNCETMVAVGVIYMTDANLAMFRQIDSSGNVAPPFLLSSNSGRRGAQSYDSNL